MIRDEGTGGAVTFTSFVEPGGSLPHLVSSSGRFHRHSGLEPPFPDQPRTYVREIVTGAHWCLLPPGQPSPCVGNVSFPVSSGGQVAACVAEHWGR